MRKIYYNEAIIDENEINSICQFITGKANRLAYGEEVLVTEKKLADFLKVKHCLLTNSGSSANLLAFMALTSPELKERRIERDDEIITTALGFPTTISPIVNYGAVPVFVDVDLWTMNINIERMKEALSPKTKAVVVAHTLGNPANIDAIMGFCEENGLYFIEDNCDSLGSKYNNKLTGTFGDIGTSSFYPAHAITMGEGGAVYTNNTELHNIMRSMRDWGRDYKCSECTWDCKKRFDSGYDCRYTYSHFGYNLKVTEMQALILNKQIDKLPMIIEKRKLNWKKLRVKLDGLGFPFQSPTPNSDPLWFSFVLIAKEHDRDDLTEYLERNGIGTRVIFGGNLTKQKCFKTLSPLYRVVGDLKNSDYIMENAFFIGCHPGMTDEDMDYIVEAIERYVQR
ncbi:MAG: lipopolysaccharide biosynthesis protein RfbH [PVC group bacterium]|nr:lipopolysaccharide biosynthesis protein RfbH [PVC group bacterium]